MGDQPATRARELQQLTQRHRRIDPGQISLQRLLHRTGHHTEYPVYPERPPLAAVGQHGRDPVDADFGRLLGEPLVTVDVFRRRDGQMQRVRALPEALLAAEYLEPAAARRSSAISGPAHRSPGRRSPTGCRPGPDATRGRHASTPLRRADSFRKQGPDRGRKIIA